MKTTYALRTASFAIAMSLAGIAHAQDDVVTSDDTDAQASSSTEEATKGNKNGGKAGPKKNESPSTTESSTAESSPTVAVESDGTTEALRFSADLEGSTSNYGDITPFAVGSLGEVGTNDVDALYGDIVAFYGDIDAFWGDINPFYGDINAFYGDISPFWGDISPFYGDISAFWGDIDAFWGDIVAFDQAHLVSIGDFWKDSRALIRDINIVWNELNAEQIGSDGYDSFAGVRDKLRDLAIRSGNKFGANVTAKTGKSFDEGFTNVLLARHGIDMNDPESFRALTDAQRAAFFIDWHDSLNMYSGIDAVDHWMGAINWTPALTQIQGGEGNSVIGIIDSDLGMASDYLNNLVGKGGGLNQLNGHGAGVASLIAGAHDGNGVMGIAPYAKMVAYNPFAVDGTATWDSVASGILSLKGTSIFNTKLNKVQSASIINLSLGEKGWVASQGLFDLLNRPEIAHYKGNTVYVVAAGNDGITQTQNIRFATNTNLQPKTSLNQAMIFVGSVRPDGTISNFSNRPGDACLLDQYGMCRADGGKLMDYFIVAPGELLLVSDGNGGVTRRSGTSFAAPLVSGAITLLHDRWPWLADNPHATTEIIFRSARDLGAPGVDPIYGHGLLDVVASQSPLDFNAMQYTYYVQKGNNWKPWYYDASSILWNYTPKYWETNNVFLTAIEQVGGTHRDFLIPASAFHYGTQNNTLGNGYQRMQDFVADRFVNWVLSGGTDKEGDGKAGISQVRSGSQELRGEWKLAIDAIQPRYSEEGMLVPVHNAATLTDPTGKLAFTLGHGQGALAMSGKAFGVISDYDPFSGGVNPILGLASGDLFGQASYKVLPNTKISFGFSATREDIEELNTRDPLEEAARRALGAREAAAMTVSLEQKVTSNVTVNAQWTQLEESDAMFGLQASMLNNGAATDAVTVSASIDFGDGFTFDLSATGAASDLKGDQILTNKGKVWSTAGQVAVNKRGVLGQRDTLRVSAGQPLNVEDGELEFSMLQVVDRQTGELGRVTQSFGIDTKRRYSGEVVYATPLGNTAELGLFGRYVSEGGVAEDEGYMIGANFGLRF